MKLLTLRTADVEAIVEPLDGVLPPEPNAVRNAVSES